MLDLNSWAGFAGKVLGTFFLWLAAITSFPAETKETPVPTAKIEETAQNMAEVPAQKPATEIKKESKEQKEKPPVQKPEVKKELPPKASPAKPELTPAPTLPDAPSPDTQDLSLKAAPSALIPQATLNERVRAALVNIICTTERGGSFLPITASGVFIDPRGIILTNAHAAQYLLLARYAPEYDLSCVGRTGSPAYPKYTLDILYLPPEWVAANKENIIKEDPTGTGEFDFAILYVSGTIGGQSLPSTFPYIRPSLADPPINKTLPYLVAAYPAGFLSGIFVQNNLYASSATLFATEFSTFYEKTIDLLSFGGSVLAQKGASGGAAVDSLKGELAGILVTIADAKQTENRDLRAVTVSHMDRVLREFEGLSLEEFLDGDIPSRASAFSLNYAPRLTKLLTDVLERK